MKRIPKVAYTLEFKLEALRRVRGGEPVRQVGREIGVPEQSIRNWVKAQAAGKLGAVEKGRPITPEQMELTRLRAEVARLKMETEILKNRLRGLPRPICVETRGGYTAPTPGQWPLAFWRRTSPSKNLAQGKLRTQLWWHLA